MMPKKDPKQDIVNVAKAVSFQEAVENCAFFIEEYVYIESKGGAETEIKFKLWPVQKLSLKWMLTFRFLMFLKARQLGCTWLVLAYALWLLLRPSKRVIALSKTEIDANALVQRVEFMLRHLPEWFIIKSPVPIPGAMTYDSTMTWVKIRHPSGEDSIFMSLPAAQNAGASLTADLVIADEWGLQEWAAQIYRAAFPTINRPGGGQFFGISTMRIGTFFHKMVLGALHGTNDYKLIFWPWDSDPSRDREWYERTARNYPGNMKSDYPATIEEAISQAEGCFFSELDREIHLREPLETIPSHYQRFAVLDYGLDMLHVLWVYVDTNGRYRVYRELYGSDLTIPKAADMILEANAGDELAGFFAPPDMWNRRQDTGKSFAESFAEREIYLTKTDNRREQGWEQLKELLTPFTTKNEQTETEYISALLTFDEGACPEIWRCMTTIQRDPGNYNDVLDKTPDDHALTHGPDALRYFAAGRTFPSVAPVMGKPKFPFEQEEKEGDYIVWDN